MNIQNTDYDDHIKTSFRGLYENQKFSDVSIMADDFEEFKGHRIILSQASPLLDKLMMFNNPLVYLRGVNSEVLKTILEYIYTGSVMLKEDQVSTFIRIAQELKIRNLSKSASDCSEPLTPNQTPNDSTTSKRLTDEPKPENIKEQTGKTCDNEHDKKKFSCDQCGYSSSRKPDLKKHQLRQHKTTFACESCDYTSSEENHLKIHNSYVHRTDDIKRESMDKSYDAELEELLQEDDEDEQGDDMTETVEASHSEISQLQDDVKNINSTQCPGCDKKFSSKHSCVRHFRMVHLRERHSCDVCNSTFANKDRVKLHMKSKHSNL